MAFLDWRFPKDLATVTLLLDVDGPAETSEALGDVEVEDAVEDVEEDAADAAADVEEDVKVDGADVAVQGADAEAGVSVGARERSRHTGQVLRKGD